MQIITSWFLLYLRQLRQATNVRYIRQKWKQFSRGKAEFNFPRNRRKAERRRSACEAASVMDFSFPRLALRARVALRAKYRVRPAWLIKRLSCRLPKWRLSRSREAKRTWQTTPERLPEQKFTSGRRRRRKIAWCLSSLMNSFTEEWFRLLIQ